MNAEQFERRVREVCAEQLPSPGAGSSAERHARLMEIAAEDLSVARLAEAHFDAVAILEEAGREPEPDALYGVWAAEKPGKPLRWADGKISGTKVFCSGAGIVDRALVTVEAPDPWLVDVDLRRGGLEIDAASWKPSAFALTNTATVEFRDVPAERSQALGERGWYLSRPGFWHGALGPASCWAGGALGIVEWMRTQKRADPHTLAHRGAMEALAWSLRATLKVAGDEMDAAPSDAAAAHARALTVRHLVEQACAEILERFGRAYGPYPLAFVEDVSRRCQELTIYLRQCHAERDLQALGELLSRDGAS